MSQELVVNEPKTIATAEDAQPSPEFILIERLVKDPDVSVDKLERIIALQDQVRRRQAEEAFNRAFVEMQSEIPVVIERGKGDKNMSYARFDDIVETVKPVLKKYGFFLSHSTQFPDGGDIIITGILTHAAGHQRETTFRGKADQSGSKNAIQAQGSTLSYGRRYTTLDLLNIVSREDDDDGERAGGGSGPEPPPGFEDWFLDLKATSEEGTDALEATWKSSPKDKLRYVMSVPRLKAEWEKIKRDAAKKANA